MNASIEAKPARRALPPLMSLSEVAAERLRALYAKGDQGKFLRIAV
ncbi:MAG: iron-sulfur cluster assembly accessory protein, partial [Roseomonas sp.]|nr:iron-sulfur cluster assembly accessory protein [Roseomonas sp.]